MRRSSCRGRQLERAGGARAGARVGRFAVLVDRRGGGRDRGRCEQRVFASLHSDRHRSGSGRLGDRCGCDQQQACGGERLGRTTRYEHGANPFPRGLVGLRSEAGLLAPGPTPPRLPVPPEADRWLRARGALRQASPVTVAGPRRIRTGFPSPPTVERGDPTPRARGSGRFSARSPTPTHIAARLASSREPADRPRRERGRRPGCGGPRLTRPRATGQRVNRSIAQIGVDIGQRRALRVVHCTPFDDQAARHVEVI